MEVLCIRSILSNGDNNISVTVYKTQPTKKRQKNCGKSYFPFFCTSTAVPACESLLLKQQQDCF